MAERSFKAEVEHLKLGEGDTFTGEGILAITKALLESGVGYVGGYQGAPISHLMDVFADAQELLDAVDDFLDNEGIQFNNLGDLVSSAIQDEAVFDQLSALITFVLWRRDQL